MMRSFLRFALVAALALVASSGVVPALPTETAHADSFTIDPGAPKGVIGYDGIRCIGEADAGGHHFRYVAYVGADGDEPADSEHAWQASECNRILKVDMVRWAATPYNGEYCLLWHPDARNPGIDEPPDLYCYRKPAVHLDPASIKVTIQRV